MTESIKVEGLTTLRATLKVAAKRVGDMSRPAQQTAAYLSTRGRADAPRRTGRLSASVRGSTDGDDVAVTSALPYANRTHWGFARYRQRAQPWLLEGAENSESSWIRNYERQIDSALAGVRGDLSHG